MPDLAGWQPWQVLVEWQAWLGGHRFAWYVVDWFIIYPVGRNVGG